MKWHEKPVLDGKQFDAYIGEHRTGSPGWRQRMEDWHGFTASNARECPRVVAGKRCLIVNCLCQYGGAVSHLLDHKGIWLDRNRCHVFTAEPYTNSLDLDLLEEFRGEAKELGLDVRLSAASPWFPTQTVLLLVRKGE